MPQLFAANFVGHNRGHVAGASVDAHVATYAASHSATQNKNDFILIENVFIACYESLIG